MKTLGFWVSVKGNQRAEKGPAVGDGDYQKTRRGRVGHGQDQRLIQQVLFSPGPGSCPAWALPRTMALVLVLFCLCLATFAKISERAESK
jgi:hypothetical protein